ncbi:hypothetical protein ACP70R_021901 [Stipagrostis hirtigluma subsp. patula]
MADEGGHHQPGCRQRRHFLIVAYGIQSHVNPGRVLAHRLTSLAVDGSVAATLSLPVHAHRRMFPSSAGDEEVTDGVISYIPYSDGFDDGSMPKDAEAWERSHRASFESLSAVVARLAARGQPVTCVMCTMVLPSVLDVAREHGIPLAVYWIQPATVLTAFYHYFHGYGELVASHAGDPAFEVKLPGLSRPLRIRDFPSFLVDTTGSELSKVVNEVFQELFEYMEQWPTKVLVNTFDELEGTVLAEMKQHLDLFAVGPTIGSSTEARIHLFKHDDDDKNRYMEWLGAQRDKSVVYVSFGSISKYSKRQIDEILQGLQQCGRPFLLVVRKDGLEEDVGHCLETVQCQGLVVDWCNQLEVLSHSAVGCFVTHCGWNSTLEAIALGVPIVAVPNMVDQPTNAYLVEEEWMIGNRAERNGEGILTGIELARGIELVMDESAKAAGIRKNVKALKKIAQEIEDAGGPAKRNLRDFIETIQTCDTV